jgi:hypothetical protein
VVAGFYRKMGKCELLVEEEEEVCGSVVIMCKLVSHESKSVKC